MKARHLPRPCHPTRAKPAHALTASGCALQARAIAEKFVLKKPPPGETYLKNPWSVTTNPVGHPTRQSLVLNPDYHELIKEGVEGIRTDVARNLARNDLFKKQRDFLKEQATRRDRLAGVWWRSPCLAHRLAVCCRGS